MFLQVRNLIIGAGPTGLGAAWRLREAGEESFLVLERADHAGGLAASFMDDAGFTWDIGGHVVFSHYEYFDRVMDELLGDESLWHERISRVRCSGTWIPYPFQNNVRHLPPEDRWRCVEGLLPGRRPESAPTNFARWIETVFGRGIAELFMWPYNFKVWATPPELMQFGWIGERVSVVDLERTLRNIVLERDEVAWGPNNTFRFPLRGGTGEIFRRMAARLGDKVRLGSEVVRIDAAARTVRTADGLEIGYGNLLSTGPVDRLASAWMAEPEAALVNAAATLTRNGVHVTGVGLDGARSDETCWMYFPESDCPFYRVTNFHNYSPNNVARPGAQRGLMCETSFSDHKPEDLDAVPGRTEDGLVATTLMDESDRDRVLSRWTYATDYGYPVPCLRRDDALRAILPRLESLRIFSRGRFGGWKYEVGNMDHSVMQGVEWADRMLTGAPETTYTL